MRLDDTYLSQGAILQCCALTLLSLAENEPQRDYPNGAVVKCKRSGRKSHQLILMGGVWRWADPKAAEMEERERLRLEGKLFNNVTGRTDD